VRDQHPQSHLEGNHAEPHLANHSRHCSDGAVPHCSRLQRFDIRDRSGGLDNIPGPNGQYRLTGVEYFQAVLLRDLATQQVAPRFEPTPWDPAKYEVVNPQPQLFGHTFHLSPPPVPHVPGTGLYTSGSGPTIPAECSRTGTRRSSATDGALRDGRCQGVTIRFSHGPPLCLAIDRRETRLRTHSGDTMGRPGTSGTVSTNSRSSARTNQVVQLRNAEIPQIFPAKIRGALDVPHLL
jgi:hypothetical protein